MFEGKGDPRVIAVMLVVLSALWSSLLVWGASFLGYVAYTPMNVATVTLIVMAVTYVLVLR
ncbi:hypothetical protein [Halospeciosus flavus]|uniref:DUF8107 domain-containing protein n=1 Tax=Halospeciosus flavus TaxID=3032283 RepID=A0ABD5Z6X6_9EURY|nr:hypothetical protein [Halospeciosus flavus]